MTELYLVRHGETDWNRARRVQGRTDVPLNDTGRAQARATGRLLARRRWDAVLSSPLSRAVETAQLIAAEIGLPEPEVFEGIMERDYGEAEGLNYYEIERRWPRGGVPGRESRGDVASRVVPALVELAVARPGQSLVVVGHGGSIRAALAAASPAQAHEVITNGSIHSFRVVDGDLRLIAFDDPIEQESIGDLDTRIELQNAVEAQDEDDVA